MQILFIVVVDYSLKMRSRALTVFLVSTKVVIREGVG